MDAEEEELLRQQREFLAKGEKSSVKMVRRAGKKPLVRPAGAAPPLKLDAGAAVTPDRVTLGPLPTAPAVEQDVVDKGKAPMDAGGPAAAAAPVAVQVALRELDASVGARTAPPSVRAAAGFPKAVHRREADGVSRRVQAYQARDRARQQEALRRPADAAAAHGEAAAIHEENLARLAQMTPEEIEEERRELLARLDPALVEMLRKRGERSAGAVSAMSSALADAGTVEDEPVDEQAEDEEAAKMEWMQPVVVPRADEADEESAPLRFDFDGNVVPWAKGADVPTNAGLHHHGDEAHLAGYALHELYHLMQSTVAAQRIVALKIVAGVCRKLDGHEHAARIVSEMAPLNLAVGLRIAIDDKNVSVMNAAVHALAALVAPRPQETAVLRRVADSMPSPLLAAVFPLYSAAAEDDDDDDDDDDAQASQFGQRVDKQGPTDAERAAKDLIDGLVRMNLLPRLRYLLEVVRSPPLVEPVLDMLLRIARHSPSSAYALSSCPRLLTVLVDQLLLCTGPEAAAAEQAAADEAPPARPYVTPSPAVLDILAAVAACGQVTCRQVMEKTDVLEALPRFVNRPIGVVDVSPADRRLFCASLDLLKVALVRGSGLLVTIDLFPCFLPIVGLPDKFPLEARLVCELFSALVYACSMDGGQAIQSTVTALPRSISAMVRALTKSPAEPPQAAADIDHAAPVDTVASTDLADDEEQWQSSLLLGAATLDLVATYVRYMSDGDEAAREWGLDAVLAWQQWAGWREAVLVACMAQPVHAAGAGQLFLNNGTYLAAGDVAHEDSLAACRFAASFFDACAALTARGRDPARQALAPLVLPAIAPQLPHIARTAAAFVGHLAAFGPLAGQLMTHAHSALWLHAAAAARAVAFLAPAERNADAIDLAMLALSWAPPGLELAAAQLLDNVLFHPEWVPPVLRTDLAPLVVTYLAADDARGAWLRDGRPRRPLTSLFVPRRVSSLPMARDWPFQLVSQFIPTANQAKAVPRALLQLVDAIEASLYVRVVLGPERLVFHCLRMMLDVHNAPFWDDAFAAVVDGVLQRHLFSAAPGQLDFVAAVPRFLQFLAELVAQFADVSFGRTTYTRVVAWFMLSPAAAPRLRAAAWEAFADAGVLAQLLPLVGEEGLWTRVAYDEPVLRAFEDALTTGQLSRERCPKVYELVCHHVARYIFLHDQVSTFARVQLWRRLAENSAEPDAVTADVFAASGHATAPTGVFAAAGVLDTDRFPDRAAFIAGASD